MVIKSFGDRLGEWKDILTPWIISEDCDNVFKKIKEDRITNKIYPNSPDLFNFLKVSPSDLKVIIVGSDPYPGRYRNRMPHATGYSLDNRYAPDNEPQPSLKKFIEGIALEYNDTVDVKCNLDYLINQGVMLANRSLTCKYRKIGDHIGLWDGFWRFFFENLTSICPYTPILLLGQEAEKLEKYIFTMAHPIFKLTHPSNAARSNIDWTTNNTFHNINKQLQTPINWLY